MNRSFLLPKIISAVVIILLLLPCLLTACDTSSPIEKTYLAMDTVMEIKIYDGAEELLTECGKIIDNYDKKWAVNDENSLICALNHGTPLADADTVELIKKCVEISASTDGAFDVTVYPIVASYGFVTKDFRVPDESEITSLLTRVGSDKIVFDDSSVTLNPDTEIDLGGIAKGYLSDAIRTYLINNGVTSAVINLGGNVMTIGKKQNKDWKVAVADPYGDGYVGIMKVSDLAVVTSGLYERYFEKDGVKYGHIIAPKTGKPVNNGILSVTVVGQNGTMCDALSTALFVMGEEKATEYILAHDIDAMIVTENKIIITNNLEKITEFKGNYTHSQKVVLND